MSTSSNIPTPGNTFWHTLEKFATTTTVLIRREERPQGDLWTDTGLQSLQLSTQTFLAAVIAMSNQSNLAYRTLTNNAMWVIENVDRALENEYSKRLPTEPLSPYLVHTVTNTDPDFIAAYLSNALNIVLNSDIKGVDCIRARLVDTEELAEVVDELLESGFIDVQSNDQDNTTYQPHAMWMKFAELLFHMVEIRIENQLKENVETVATDIESLNTWVSRYNKLSDAITDYTEYIDSLEFIK